MKRMSIGDFRPDEADRSRATVYWRSKERFDLVADLSEQIEAFRDHHIALGSLMADWHAAWRTWVRYAIKFNRKPPLQPREFTDRAPNRYAGRTAFKASDYDTPPRSNIRSAAEIISQAKWKRT